MTVSRFAMLLAILGVVVLAAPELAVAAPAVEGAAQEQPDLVGTAKTRLVTAITTLVVFLLLVAVLGKYAWGPIAAGLQAREDKIRKEIADAEAARARAEATLKEYSAKLTAAEAQIRDMIAKAQQDAEGVATGITLKAQEAAQEIKERATKEIEGSKNAAMAELHEHAAELATTVASKILRRQITENDQRELVRSSLDELASVAGR